MPPISRIRNTIIPVIRRRNTDVATIRTEDSAGILTALAGTPIGLLLLFTYAISFGSYSVKTDINVRIKNE